MKFLSFISGCALFSQPSIVGGVLCIVMMLFLGLSIRQLQNTEFLKQQKKSIMVLLVSIVIWIGLAVAFVDRWRSRLLYVELPGVSGANLDYILYFLAVVSSISILFIAVCINFLWSETNELCCTQDEAVFQYQKSKKGLVVTCALMLVASIVICIQSPTNIFSDGTSGTDSSVFRYIGWLMTRGYVPYKDAFDHKGPLTYFINYIGMLLSFDYGIWIIEFVFMTLTVLISYRLARLFANARNSLIAMLAAFTLFATYFEWGNYTEEWALPFILIAVYVFMDYFVNERLSGTRVLLCGSSFACVVLLRANMIAVWIVFSIMFLIHCVREQAWRRLIKATIYFMLGILIIGIPVVIYLYKNHAWNDFVENYIIFNIAYSGKEGWTEKILAGIYFATAPQFLAGIGIVILIVQRSGNKEKNINIGYLILMFAAVLMAAMSGYRYGHYGMTLIPLMIYPYSFFIEKVRLGEAVEEYGGKRFADTVKMGIGVSMGIVWIGMLMNGVQVTRQNDEDLNQVVHCINNMLDKNGEIIVFGNRSLVYLKSQRFASSKYFYQNPISSVDKSIEDNFVDELEMNPPGIVVIYDVLKDYEKTFLEDNAYEAVGTYGTYVVYRLPGV